MTSSRRNLFTAIAAVLLIGVFYMMALKPKHQEAAKLQTEVTSAQSALDQARALLATNQEARKAYRQAYASVVRLGKAVPADDDVRSLVVQLDAAAKKTKVDFRSIAVTSNGGAAPAGATAGASLPPGATVGPAGFPVMPFSFAFKGSFFSLASFFQQLEGFVASSSEELNVTGRLLTLDSLNLEPDAEGFPKIKATVEATSYLVSPMQGLTAGATAQGPAGSAATPATTAPATPAAPSTGAPAAPTTATSTGALR